MTQLMETSPVAAAYGALAHGLHELERGKGDLAVLQGMVTALLQLGLGGIAQRVLETANLTIPDWEQMRAGWVESVRQSPTGKVAWASRRRRFHANLASLVGRDVPDLAAFWEAQQSRYELYHAVDGNVFVLDTQAANPLMGTLGGLIDHRAGRALWTMERKEPRFILPIAFDGAGYGWLLLRAFEATHESYLQYSCAIYVIEPDLAAFCVLLHVQDLRTVLGTPRLRLFLGEGCAARFEQAFREKPDWTIPEILVANPLTRRAAAPLQEIVKRVHAAQQAEQAALLEQVNAYYADKTPAYWADRLAAAHNGGPPLKVLGITTRYSTVLQYSMREWGEAIAAAGHEFTLSIESDDQSLERPEIGLLARHKPDVVVQITRMRYENPALPRQVPFLCWDQDNLPCMRTAAATKSLDAFTYVAGHGAAHGLFNLGWPERNCIFFKAAGSTHRYSNAPVAPELRARFACDFSYVSNASGTPEAVLAEQLAAWQNNPTNQRLLAAAGERVLAQSRGGYAWDFARLTDSLRTQAAELEISLPTADGAEMVRQLYRVSDRAFRHVALEWVVAYCQSQGCTFRLFGRGWKGHPVLGRYAEDFIAPGESFRALYQATKINLQIIESGFVHSRVLDGLAAGGFFLSRFSPEARDHDGTGRFVHAMAVRALALGLRSNGELQDSKDPIIARGWAVMAENITPEELRRERPCRYLRLWAASPTEEVAFPQLDEITFTDQDSFARLATRFLNDEAARRRYVDAMRRVVMEQFSYDACWRESLAAIARGLQAAAGRGA